MKILIRCEPINDCIIEMFKIEVERRAKQINANYVIFTNGPYCASFASVSSFSSLFPLLYASRMRISSSSFDASSSSSCLLRRLNRNRFQSCSNWNCCCYHCRSTNWNEENFLRQSP